MSICLVISYTLAFLQRKACHMHSTVICISVSHISSGTTGNTEVRKQNSTRTAVLKTGIFMPSFVVLRLLSDSSFVTTEALKSSEQKLPTYLDILDSLVYRIYNSNIRAHCARARTHTHTHTHTDIVYLLVITTIKTVKNPSLCSANTILKLSTWDTDGRAKNTHLLVQSCPTSLKIKITDFPKTRQPIVCSPSSSFRCKKVFSQRSNASLPKMFTQWPKSARMHSCEWRVKFKGLKSCFHSRHTRFSRSFDSASFQLF